jgi:hypothetical protein
MVCVAHEIPACIYDNDVGLEQRFHLFEEYNTLLVPRNQARCRGIQHAGSAFDLRKQSTYTSLACCAFRMSQRCVRFFCAQAPHCDSRNHQLVESP